MTEENNSITDNEARITNLNESLQDIDSLDKDKNKYSLGYSSRDESNVTVYKYKDVIYISGGSTDEHINEIKHVVQSLNAAGLKFNKNDKLLNADTRMSGLVDNEVEAYRTQYFLVELTL